MKTHPSSSERSMRRGAEPGDPALVPFVTASIAEIRRAQRLRERLKERFPNRPSRPVSYWSVGAD
ncbi:MAG TPA: hypothetical protein VMN79_05610 [Casimicrobiaceae bacterium]|nr:hypothetical protein [Casimicrobiaceae bacterium]